VFLWIGNRNSYPYKITDKIEGPYSLFKLYIFRRETSVIWSLDCAIKQHSLAGIVYTVNVDTPGEVNTFNAANVFETRNRFTSLLISIYLSLSSPPFFSPHCV
jgi:hypothetical protein